MARFADNPVKSPLSGAELLAGTDPDTGGDICVTPNELVAFANDHLRIADASLPGFLSVEDFQKLFNLPNFASYSATVARLAHQPIGFFVAVPANGSVTFFSNPFETYSLGVGRIRYAVSTGTLTLAINVNGTPVTGFGSLAVTSTPTTATPGGAPTIIAPGDLLSFTISSVASSPLNLWFSLEVVIVP